MKSVRNTRRALLLAITVLVSCIVSPGVTHATSTYDNTVTIAHNLILDCADSTTRNLTYNWLTYLMTDESQLNGDPLYDVSGSTIQRDYFQGEFQTTLNSTVGWSVTQVVNPDGSRHVMIFNNHANGLSFSNLGTVEELKGYATFLRISCATYGSVQGIYLDFNNSNALRVHANNNSQAITNSEPQYRPFFVNQTVTYPSGYDGVILTATPLPAKYVAMGDSFSSGEGNSPFETGTDTDDTNECHRSESAYPQWLSQTPGLHLEHMAFVACSGATIDTVLNGGEAEGAWGEPSQVNALSEHTEVVTVTIGGNDIGFKAFATACAAPLSSCDSSTTIYSTTMSDVHNVLPGLLSDMFTKIANKTDHAHVYVIGYPYATPSSGLDSLPIQCSYLNSSVEDGADSLAARAIVTNLNEEIDDAVTEFTNTLSDSEFEYIDPNSSVDGSFDGHDLCQDLDSYFHNVAPNDVFGNGYQAKIFHPNVTGQYEYYQIVKGVIEQN